MIISNMTFKKMGKFDPRYPDPMPNRPAFSAVYLLECETDEGPKECPFFFFEGDAMTPATFGNVLEAAAASIRRLEKLAA
jgi:hypothetical protein